MKKFTSLMFALLTFIGATKAQITSIDELSSTGVYTITPKDATRGVLYATSSHTALDACGGTRWNGSNTNIAVDENSENQQFAFYEYNEKLYLYSIAAGKFVKKSGGTTVLTSVPEQYVTLTAQDDNYFIIALNGTNYINVSTGFGGTNNIRTDYNTPDDGNKFAIKYIKEMSIEPKSRMASPTISSATTTTITEAKQATLYTIKSARTGKYLYHVADGSKPKQTQTLDENCYWYFTEGTDGALAIHNTKTSQVLGNNCSMGESGQWFISPATYRFGITIAQNSDGVSTCIDEQSSSIGTWNHSVNDNEGTTWYLEEVARTSVDLTLAELNNMWIKEIGTPATSLTTGQWYVLKNFKREGYVSQETASLKMRATESIDIYNDACEKAGYLFKLVQDEDGEHYNLISGNGFYFSLGLDKATVSLDPVNYEIALIGDSENNFYIYDKENNYTADGQGIGDNFVGWSSTIPTTAGGNDSYQFLPVTLTDETAELTYALTDVAGNQYTGTYTGTPQKDLPTITGAYGYELGNINWNRAELNATIEFFFPVSKVGETPNETMLAVWDATRYLRAEGTNIRVATTEKIALDLNALWAIYPSFDNGAFKFTIKNIATGKYIYSEAADNTSITQKEGTVILSETASEFVLPSDKDLRFADKNNLYLSINGTNDLNVLLGVHKQPHGGTNIFAPATIYNVTVTDAGYATFYASNAVTIPENVKAYYIAESGINSSWVELTEITGTIPAKTAVILEAAAGTHTFNKAADVEGIEGNQLEGTVENEMISGEAYVLTLLDGKAGLGKAKLTENQFLNNHHKAYLPTNSANGATFYSFGFDWGGTTGIENIEDAVEENATEAIYDITGRQIKAITVPGIYIINGKKTFVK